MSLSSSNDGIWNISGQANFNETGSYVIDVLAVDTSGLQQPLSSMLR